MSMTPNAIGVRLLLTGTYRNESFGLRLVVSRFAKVENVL